MALTPEQQARLNELEAKEKAIPTTGLSPEQQARLEELEAKEQSLSASKLTPEQQARLEELEAKEASFMRSEPRPDYAPEELSFLEKATLMASDFANQFNRSLGKMVSPAVDMLGQGMARAHGLVKDGKYVDLPLTETAADVFNVKDEEPKTKAGYVGQVGAEAVAFTVPALKFASVARATKPASAAGKILQGAADQFVKEATENTGRFLAIESGVATGAGVARSIANEEELSPGAALAVELFGGIAGAFSGQGLRQVSKSLLNKVKGKNATEIAEMVSNGTIKYEELDFIPVQEVEGKYGFKPIKFDPETPKYTPEATPAPNKFTEDIPSEDWLEGKIEDVIDRGTNRYGVPRRGSVTGYFDSNLELPLDKTKSLKGANGEDVVGLKQDKVDELAKVLEEGGELDPPLVGVHHDGTPYILEGNHRIAASQQAGVPIKVEVKYFDGGQRKAIDGWKPEQLKPKDTPEPTPAAKPSMPGEAQRLIEFDRSRREMADSISNKQKAEAAVSLNNLDNYDPKSKLNPKKAVERILRIFAPSKLVGPEITSAIEKSKGTIARLQESGARVLRATKRLEKANPDVKEHVNSFLETGTMHPSLTPVEAELSVWKTQINEMQNLLLDGMDDAAFEGLKPEIQKQLRATIEASIEEGYLTQTYRMFQDKDYMPTQAQMKAAIQEIKTDLVMKGVTVEKAEEMARKHLNRLQANSARSKKIHGRPQGAMPESRGILKERTNPGPAERAWLGEVTDPKEKAFSTASRLARLASAQEEDVAIVRLLLDGKMATRQQVDPSQVQLKLRVSEGESGIWVSEDAAGALDILRFGANNPLDTGNIFMDAIGRTWNSFVASSKATKVLLNPDSYPVNLLGAMLSTATAAINPFRLNGIKSALSQFGSLDDILGGKNLLARKAFLEDVGKMQQHGLMSKSVNAADIEKNIQKGLTEYSKALSKGTKATVSWLGKAYSSSDISLRYTTWKGNQKQLKKMFPDYSDMEIEAAAARLTNETFPNYDKLSPIIKGLSRVGGASQFVAFPAELTRNIYNSAKYSQQMMRGTFGKEIGLDPTRADLGSMRLTGLKRGAALTATITGSGAVVSQMNQNKGLNEQAEVAFQKTIARDWDQNKRLLIVPDETGRKGRYVNPSYLFPHAIANQAFQAGFSEEPITNLAGFFKEQYIGEPGSFPARVAAKLLFGRDERGRLISVDPRTHQQALDAADAIYEDTLRPGAQNTFERWSDTLAGRGERTVRDNALRLLGFRDTTWDAGKSFQSKIYTINEPIKEAQRRYYSERRKLEDNRTSQEEVQKSYEENNTARKLQMNIIREHYRNMGMEPWAYSVDERISLMKEAGFSSSAILDIVDGRYTDIPKVPQESTADMYDNLKGSTTKDKLVAIKEVRETDPGLAKKLFNYHKRLISLDKRKITEREKLIAVMDGARKVDYLIEMGVHTNRALLEEYKRKGIINKDVLKSIRIKTGR
jgi:hypothetical protein